MSDIKHPEIVVRLTGQDSNAFMILGLANRAMKAAGLTQEERDEFRSEAMSGDHGNLLRVCMRWFTIE